MKINFISLKHLLLTPCLLMSFSLVHSRAGASEFIFENDPSLPLVNVTVVFKGGASSDPDRKNGLTDLMGKLMLRGTKSKTKNQVDLTLDQLGSTLSVDSHAEYLSFHASVLSENIQSFVQLLAEIITSPSFRSDELEKLKKEQVSQLTDELANDRGLVNLRFNQAFFKGHPYAKSNQGRVSDIKNIQIADIQNQFQNLINDSQMVVLASGDTRKSSFDDFLNQVKEKRTFANSMIAPVNEFKNFPSKMKVILFDKPGRTQTQIAIGQKGIPITSPDVDALSLANFAFGGGSFQSRLMVELRVKRGWTYGAGSNFKFGSQPHSWKMGFFPKNSDTPAALAESLKMLRNLKESGLTQQEFNFAKQSLVNSSGFSYNTPSKRMENTLIEKMFGLPDGYHKNAAQRISALTLEQVNLALKNFIDPDHILIGIVATASQTKASIAKALKIPENEIEVQDFLKE